MTPGKLILSIVAGLSIFAVLAGGVAWAFVSHAHTSADNDRRLDLARNEVAMVHQLVEQYMLARRECPMSLRDIVEAGISSKVRRDPWGQDYEIRCTAGTAEAIDVRSIGPDGKTGTTDDVSSRA
jgi:general secretion pathway protein G